MSFTPYLFFDGNCADALAFYAKVFDADNSMKMRYDEAPPDVDMPKVDRLMHAQIDVGTTTLMMSDIPPDSPRPDHSGVAIAHQVADIKDAKRKFDALLAGGGAVTMPFEETFFSPGFGMCKDRFGVHWMIMVDGDET